MSIALDGFKILRRLGESPEAFSPVRADADKAARALVVKCLKAKSTGIDALRAINKAIHDKQLALVVEGLKDAELKSVLARIDKHHPDLMTQSAQERRTQLLALSSGARDPSPPIAKAKAAKAKKASKKITETAAPTRLRSDVMDLFRARGKAKED